MDPNSGKLYRDPTAEQKEKLGLVEVSEEVAEMVTVGAAIRAMDGFEQRQRDTKPTKRKTDRSKKNAVARASRRKNR